MGVDVFESLREDAARLHAELVQAGADPGKPEALVVAAIERRGLTLTWLAPDDPALKGARALHDEELRLLCCAQEPDPAKRAVMLAHEIGHVCLHGSVLSLCGADDIDPSRSMESAPVGLERVEDYGAHERRELQANVFGRELLLPRSLARRFHVEEDLSAQAISEKLLLPKDLVRQQLIDALLLPPVPAPTAPALSPIPTPDPSQDEAAAHRESAFLLQAGPGTGKTRTLVKRLAGLLEENVDPASILVLTFSNRAAGELAERITALSPEAAPRIWIGTFHAFGLDLIRRYHVALQLPSDPILFDRSDAIEVLEEILPTLPLRHYRNLWDPAMVLKDIVSAISRAKDELVGPVRYRELAERKRSAASTPDDREAGEKACEVAEVYERYEQALHERSAVDFGDLIMRPTVLLQEQVALRTAVQLRHRHLLVDEYQDVNRASTQLLRVLAGEGERLWAVGDARQSIYRFRGASSANLSRFLKEYPNAKTAALRRNYRSSREILDLVEGFADKMDASKDLLPLRMEAERGASGHRPQLHAYQAPENEISGIAANVRALERSGIALRDQAVLCRTNPKLNEIAAGLEARGIPVLHLGSLFERGEIRDCLALMSLAIDPYGSGLVRVATFARYRMSLEDVQIATSLARQLTGSALTKLSQIADDPRLTPPGATALRRLSTDLKGLTGSTTSWEFLATWMLDRTRYVVELSRDDNVAARMRAVALWQFLNFVRTPGPPVQGPPIRRTLDRVRQLVLLAEERDLRQVPASALHMNAVRLMTIHGSKGLEFEAVHVPGLVTTGLPCNPQGQRCPPPDGMIEGPEAADSHRDVHAREEECLFFVATSRAKVHLQLTRFSKQDNGSARSPSAYVGRIDRFVDARSGGAEIALPATAPRPQPITVHWPSGWHPTDDDVRSYDVCARRFFYTHALKLGTALKPTAFSRTHDCLHNLIRWMAKLRPATEPSVEAALDEFERIWEARGPRDHAYAEDYRRLAHRLVEALVRLGAGRRFRAAEPLALDLPNGRVLVHPSEIAELPSGVVVVRRLHTGRKRSDEYDRLEYTLYMLAGQAEFGPACQFEAVHLTDEVRDPIAITPKKMATRRDIANEILAGMRAGRFLASPDAVRCPRCPHFFICDATPEGALTPLPPA
jgi:DNA helicase-2/ATP-dependent DNA helicase PcrA